MTLAPVSTLIFGIAKFSSDYTLEREVSPLRKMKVSPRTLTLMAAATVSAPGLAWYAAEQADAYDRNYKEVMEGTAPPMEETVVVKVGQHVLDAWYWAGEKAGLLPPPSPCGICGMG
jgi:hypothetical protein